MRASLIAVTLAVQICTVATLTIFSGDDTLAYPMQAGYVVKNDALDLVYFDGAPARMTFERMDVIPKRSKIRSELPVYFKRAKNLRCEQRETDDQPLYRCAIDLRKLPDGDA